MEAAAGAQGALSFEELASPIWAPVRLATRVIAEMVRTFQAAHRCEWAGELVHVVTTRHRATPYVEADQVG